jgi:hypothetical protein
MTECLPRYIRFTWLVDGCHWQGADRPDGPWRPIQAPQSGLPLMTDGPAVPESREPASIAENFSAPSNEDLDALERKCWKLDSVIEHELGAGFSVVYPKEETFDHRAYARAVLARWGHRPALSADDIPPGPFSERELREQWNQQADKFNQWDSLDSCEQLAWAQARAIQTDRSARLTPPTDGEVAELVAILTSITERTELDPFLIQRFTRIAALPQQQQSEIERLRAQQPMPVELPDEEVATIADRLVELARAVTKERWSEFSMHVPARPLRDADLVISRAAKLLQQQQAEIERLRAQQTPGEREAAAVEALQRLRRWGRLSGGGYSADVVLGVVDWIDGGMEGPLPPLPAHALPMPQEEVKP